MNDVPCGRCNGTGGTTARDDDGRVESDTCYHCSGSGRIDEETARHDRVMGVIETLAERHVDDLRIARDQDPEGENWQFCAAENMQSVREYTMEQVMNYTDRFAEKFTELPDSLQMLLCDELEAKWAGEREVGEFRTWLLKKRQEEIAALKLENELEREQMYAMEHEEDVAPTTRTFDSAAPEAFVADDLCADSEIPF